MTAGRFRYWCAGIASGLSQAYGTANIAFGLAVAAALLVFEPRLFATAAWAVALALPFAARFERERFASGLYLFNPFLFGCFAFAVLGAGIRSFAAISMAVPLVVLLALRLDAIGRRAYFTMPYIAAAYVTIAVLDARLPAFPVVAVADFPLGGVVRSFAQVLLSGNAAIGAVVLLAGLVVAPLSAAAAFAVSALLSGAWIALGLPASTEAAGLVGYNAVIFTFYAGRELVSRLPQYLVAIAGGALVHLALYEADLAAYTFPFVVSGWIYLALCARLREVSAGATPP